MAAPKTPEAVGKTLAQLAAQWGKDAQDATFDLLMENHGDVDAAFFYQNEADMLSILAAPDILCSTDCGHHIAHFDREQEGGAHPRSVSCFPKRLRLVRENHLRTLEEEIRRICYLPAQTAKLDHVGLLLEGYDADICVFDWEHVCENNDYRHPFRKNTGIDTVIVGGEIAVKNGDYTGARAGRLRKKRI